MNRLAFIKSLVGVSVALQTVTSVAAPGHRKRTISLKYWVSKNGEEVFFLECSCGEVVCEVDDAMSGYKPVRELIDYRKFVSHKCGMASGVER